MIEIGSVSPSHVQPDALAAAAFLIGQDGDGHWLAVETHGLGGGIFRTEAAARRFARSETDGRPGAVALTPDRLALGLG